MPTQTFPPPHSLLPIGAGLLCVASFCAIGYSVFGLRLAGLLGMPFLIGYFAFGWHALLRTGRGLLILCAVLAAYMAFRPGGSAILALATSKAIYLPAFVAALGLLRAAASRSRSTAAAGRFLVAQPPSRRYTALTLGGHFFGVLFNIGGLALLIDMTRQANTIEAAHGAQHIVELREKRMTLAVMRGFNCIPLWSPLGVSLNLLLTSTPGLAWAEVAPRGALLAIGFMTLGWIFDRLQSPPTRTAAAPQTNPRDGFAVLMVAGHVLGLSLVTAGAEVFVDLSFQALLLLVLPLYAFCWALFIAFAGHDKKPLQAAAFTLVDRGVRNFPLYINEIAVFAASSFLGVILSALVPRSIVENALASFSLMPGVVAMMLALAVFILSVLAINPIISASIIAGLFSTLTVPGLSKADIVLALAGSWTCVIGLSPTNSSLVMISQQIGRSSFQVGPRWNGAFALTAFGLFLVMLGTMHY